jgi:hypothetical protein
LFARSSATCANTSIHYTSDSSHIPRADFSLLIPMWSSIGISLSTWHLSRYPIGLLRSWTITVQGFSLTCILYWLPIDDHSRTTSLARLAYLERHISIRCLSLFSTPIPLTPKSFFEQLQSVSVIRLLLSLSTIYTPKKPTTTTPKPTTINRAPPT